VVIMERWPTVPAQFASTQG